MNKGHFGMMFFIFLMFGILISLQFRGVYGSESGEVSAKRLTAELEAEKAENAQLLQKISNIESEREQLLKNIGDNFSNSDINDLIKIRDYEYLRAGLIPVSGKGIVITMEDALATGELDIEDYIIHDSDVNAILDELKANGAEAISINGERVIFSTKPVCAGPTISVNESRYPPPYVIKAIGDPDVLYEAIDTMADVAFMRLADIRISIEKQDQIVVDKYHLYRSLDKTFEDLEVVKK
jgi:uncharacterized protein YlxW (UPF0749 family)